MATIDFSQLGTSNSQNVQCNDLRIYNPSDDNYHLELNVASAPSANYGVSFPPESQDGTTILTDGTDIDITLLQVNSATAKTSADDSDELILYDSAGLANKKVTVANLKSSIQELPSSHNSADLLISDGSDFNAVAVSGDVTCDSTGAFTIANNAVEDEMIANAPVADGTAEASKFVKLDASKDIASLNAVSMATCSASTSVNAPIFEFGTGTTRWRMKLDASNNLSMEVSTDSGTTYAAKFVVQAS